MTKEGQENILKIWRIVGYLTFAGMIDGLLCITTFIPLTFMTMKGVDINLVAVHCKSVTHIAYWCVGFGGAMTLVYFITGLSVLVRNKKFVTSCVVILSVHFLTMFGFMVAGIVPTQTHKDFLEKNWNNFNETTTRLVQNHFSCCGFESPSEVLTKDASCYAIPDENITWPDGCYKRVMSTSLSAPSVHNTANKEVTPGSASWNNFICGFSFFFICIFIIDLMSIFGIGYLLTVTNFDELNNCSKIPPKHHKMVQENGLKEAITTVTLVAMSNSNEMPPQYDKEYPNNADNVQQTETSFSSQSHSSIASKSVNHNSNPPWYSKLSHVIVNSLERGFYWLGFLVGKHPKTTIVLSSIFTVSLCIGLIQRRDAQGGSEGFLPADIAVVNNFQTYLQYFTTKEQIHRMIIEDQNNVLTSDVFKKTWNIDKSVKEITSSTGMTFDTLCLKYTAGCGQESLFELWSYSDGDITALTDADIIQKIQPKASLQSPMFGGAYLIDNVIGDQNLDSGEISSARAHMLTYKTRFTYQLGDWESKFVELGRSSPDELTVYVQAASSSQEESSSSYTKDLPLLFAGFLLVFIYIAIMTGKFSKVRHRVVIALLGVMTAGMAMGTGIGLAASLQFEWTALHLIAPFLIIGIGVDDMFIILQTWNMVDEDPRLRSLTLEEKAGYVLKTAGVSITVTSITDLVAFAVGATSALKVFESFSVYTSLCIILLFFLQCTFFMACTVLDQKRREQNRDACICCYVYDESHKDGKLANRELFQWFFENVIGYYLEFIAVRIVTIVITLALTGLMAWGFYKLEVAYDPDWYIPSGSFVLDFNGKEDEYFARGMEVSAFVFSDDFFSERTELSSLYTTLRENKGVDNNFLRSWYNVYESWSSLTTSATEAEFYADVSTFLDTSEGNTYFYDVIFNSDRSKITATKFPFRHVKVNTANEDVKIMDSIYADINQIGFNNAFPFTEDYFVLEITKIIGLEVYRNIGITLAVVFIVVLPTIASLQMSLWVGLCVVFTIVDVAGTMYFAGLYIETSTVITLLLTVGLAVDYAAHVGHKYLTLRGTRLLRMRVALSHVGPAVFNGGFSTFLALSLLVVSNNYSYKVFFTVFTCVVWFGLWNGLIFLPSVLGFIGPPPHKTAHDALLSERAKVKKVDVHLDEPKQVYIEKD